ncbi:MAG: hypothetical protein RJA36_3221 [Pseudomonadota bacterium]|jgi:opacity protein-like surface antigen
MKHKKIALVAALAACAWTAPAAFAQSANPAGVAIGLGLGAVGTSTKVRSGTDSVELGKTTHVGSNVDLSYTFATPAPLVSVGLGATMDLGQTKSGTMSVGASNLTVRLKDHYSLYVQPAVEINPNTTLFAKLAFHAGTAEGSGSFANFSINHLSGLGTGVGIKTFVHRNVFIQAELSSVSFGKESIAGGAIKPRLAAGIVTLGYKF